MRVDTLVELLNVNRKTRCLFISVIIISKCDEMSKEDSKRATKMQTLIFSLFLSSTKISDFPQVKKTQTFLLL